MSIKNLISFRLRHDHQCKDLNPWVRRNTRPFIPGGKRDAKRVIEKVLEKVGLPPLELLSQLLASPKGGAP